MDIIGLLKEDHKKVKGIFETLESTTGAAKKKRRDGVATLEDELSIHMKFEEEVFYPEVKEGASKEGRELTCEAYAEHKAATTTLMELKNQEPAEEMWKAWLAVLKESVTHHIEEEEEEWFPQVRAGLGRKHLAEIGERMLAAKEKAPRTPAQPSALKKTVDAVLR